MKKTLNERGLYLFFPADPENIEKSIEEIHQLLLEQVKNNIMNSLWGEIYPEYMKLIKKRNLILQSQQKKEGAKLEKNINGNTAETEK